MNVRTNKKEGNYFSLARTAAADPRLSFKAVGLHTYLMSKGNNWQAEEGDLITSHKEGRAAVRAAMQELIDFGYMTRFQVRDANGRVVDWRIDTYESPEDNPHYRPGQPPQVVVEVLSKDDSHNTTLPQSENRIVDDEPESGYPQVENRTGYNNKSSVNTDLSSLPPAQPPAQPFGDIPAMERTEVTSPKPAKMVPTNSPHLPRGMRLPGGYVPAGKGTNPVQVYYERFPYGDRDARLSRPQEDDLCKLCKDLGKLRSVVEAYSRTGFRPGNVQLILDWYRDGIPAHRTGNAARGSSKSMGYGRQMAPAVSTKGQSIEDYADDPEYYAQLKALHAGGTAAHLAAD